MAAKGSHGYWTVLLTALFVVGCSVDRVGKYRFGGGAAGVSEAGDRGATTSSESGGTAGGAGLGRANGGMANSGGSAPVDAGGVAGNSPARNGDAGTTAAAGAGGILTSGGGAAGIGGTTGNGGGGTTGNGGGTTGNGGGGTTGNGGARSAAGSAGVGGAPTTGTGGRGGAASGGGAGAGGAPTFSLSVTAVGPAGSVSSVPVGQIACTAPNSGGDCSQSYPPGTIITLNVAALNGSRARFGGWSGACAGIGQTCSLTMDAPKSVGATFISYTNNLVFVSSVAYSPVLHSALAYDAMCNQLASAAGINNAGSNGFIAWTSASNSDAVTRLAGAQGFILMDGSPFADTQATFLAGNAILNPIRLSEKGVDVGLADVMTGTNSLGQVGNDAFNRTCNDFTGELVPGDSILSRSTLGGPITWGAETGLACSIDHRIYCFGKTERAALAFVPATGKRIWLSTTYSPSPATTPDAHCALSRPAGVASARALVAYSSAPAADVLDLSATYVRPDGVVVGTGAEIAAQHLHSGVWQYADGSYISSFDNGSLAFTGATSLTVNGADTCANWQDKTAQVTTGNFHSAGANFWNYVPSGCNVSAKLYCLEP